MSTTYDPKSNRSLREQHTFIESRLNDIGDDLTQLFVILDKAHDKEESQGISVEIGRLKSEARRLKLDRAQIFETLFSLEEISRLSGEEKIAAEKEVYQHLFEYRAKTEIEIASRTSNVLRNVDNKQMQDCMQATLKEVWTESVYPFFELLDQLDSNDSRFVEKTHYYSRLAIYQHKELKLHLATTDDSDIESITPVWPFNDESPEMDSTSIDKIVKNIDERYKKRTAIYKKLLNKVASVPEPIVINSPRPKKKTTIKVKKVRSIDKNSFV